MRRERGPAPYYRRALCTAAEQVGYSVYLHAPTVDDRLVVRTCDASERSKMPAWGLVVRKLSDTECIVQRYGPVMNVYEDLVLGVPYYVDETGWLDTVRIRPGYAQIMGQAIAGDVFWLDPQLVLTKLLV